MQVQTIGWSIVQSICTSLPPASAKCTMQVGTDELTFSAKRQHNKLDFLTRAVTHFLCNKRQLGPVTSSHPHFTQMFTPAHSVISRQNQLHMLLHARHRHARSAIWAKFIAARTPNRCIIRNTYQTDYKMAQWLFFFATWRTAANNPIRPKKHFST